MTILILSAYNYSVRVEFSSGANIGEPVEMECIWADDMHYKQVVWKRKAHGNKTEDIWLYEGDKFTAVVDEALIRGEGNIPIFEAVPQNSYANSHRITLLAATEYDHGVYWCVVYIDTFHYNVNPLGIPGGEWTHHTKPGAAKPRELNVAGWLIFHICKTVFVQCI